MSTDDTNNDNNSQSSDNDDVKVTENTDASTISDSNEDASDTNNVTDDVSKEYVEKQGTEDTIIDDQQDSSDFSSHDENNAESDNSSEDVNNDSNVEEDDDDDEDDDTEIYNGHSGLSIEEKITNLIATGHMFKAHAIAKKAFNKNPENNELAQAYALVLLKTGAVEESRNLVNPILGVQPQLDEATGTKMIVVDDLRKSKFLVKGNPDVISGVGLIFKEAWKYSHHCRDLELSRELYLASFKLHQKTNTGMNAAWLSWLTGDDGQSKKLAAEVLKLLPPFGLEASFAELIDLAEAQLLLGREDDACKL